MLSEAKVKEVERMLATGVSYRLIALERGVGRSTIGLIARGLRAPRRKRERDLCGTPNADALPSRCPECGALVYMPCGACRVRRFLRG